MKTHTNELFDVALKKLALDPIRNANMLGFINSYPISDVAIVGDSIMIIGTSDKPWVFISSESEEELRELATYLTPSDVNFAVIEDWMLPILTAGRKRLWTLTTLRLILPSNANPPAPASHVPTVKLTSEWSEYIYSNYSYKQYTDIAYINDRLERGPSAGVFEDGKLVAWALTHDDGAIGFLQALEEYRGKGYAMAATNAVIAQVREQGHTPFVHIEETNVKSLSLAQKTGFVIDRRVHWFELEF